MTLRPLQPVEHNIRKVAIAGLGGRGIPLALMFLNRGFYVIGLETDERNLAMLQSQSNQLDCESMKALQAAIASERLTLTKDYKDLRQVDAIIVCISAQLDEEGQPDSTNLMIAGDHLSRNLVEGQLVVLEGTVYPGFTKEVFAPLLAQSDLMTEEQYYVGYSPELSKSPSTSKTEATKIISAMSEAGLKRVEELYSCIFSPIRKVTSPSAAEMIKLLESNSRLVHTLFMNEMASVCEKMELNIWEIAEATASSLAENPYIFKPLQAGIEAGNSGQAIETSFLRWKLEQYREKSELIEQAVVLNRKAPQYIADKTIERLRQFSLNGSVEDACVLVYGVANKKDTADYIDSASIKIMQELEDRGIRVLYHDPYIKNITISHRYYESENLTEQLLRRMDAVIIAVDHSELPLATLMEHSSYVYDALNVTKGWKGKLLIDRYGAEQYVTAYDWNWHRLDDFYDFS